MEMRSEYHYFQSFVQKAVMQQEAYWTYAVRTERPIHPCVI